MRRIVAKFAKDYQPNNWLKAAVRVAKRVYAPLLKLDRSRHVYCRRLSLRGMPLRFWRPASIKLRAYGQAFA